MSLPGGSGRPRGGRNGRPCGGMLGGSPCPWGKPGGNLVMIIIMIIMIMGSQVGTSGAGWEAPEDPLDRDPPRQRGVAWPRLRRSRSAQCTS